MKVGGSNRIERAAARIVSLALGFTALAVVAPAGPVASAAAASAVVKVTDPATYRDFPGSQDPSYYASSHIPGRVWLDKTVLPDGAADQVVVGDEELLVSLSVLGATRHVSSQSVAPVDLVLVLDNSTSMTQCLDVPNAYCNASGNYTRSRAYAMTQAVNEAIRIIAADNPDNRVSIVQFGTTASVLIGLQAPRPINQAGDYVTLSAPSGRDNIMTFRAANNAQFVIGQAGGVAQSTNIQAGVFTGMSQLADQEPAEVSGAKQRVPNVLVFSDGEPTLSVNDKKWWDISAKSSTQGPSIPGGTQYAGNGFKAALTAAFLKSKITSVYSDPVYYEAHGFDAVEAVGAKVFTVGLGISALEPATSRDLAYATLNPSGLAGMDNSMADAFRAAWTAYLSGTATVPVAGGYNGSYEVVHPTDGDAVFDPRNAASGLGYNNKFYTPMTIDDMVDAFQTIANEIIDALPVFPIEDDGAESDSGVITLSDQLGPFMRVADIKSLNFCSVVEGSLDPLQCEPASFTEVEAEVVDEYTTVYRFQGRYSANNLVQQADLSLITITVRRERFLAAGDTITVEVPPELMPLRDSRVLEDRDGRPLEMVQYPSHPFHLFYTVAPKGGVVGALADPTVLNTPAAPDAGTSLAEYIARHTVSGQTRFYSNAFTAVENQPAEAGTVGVLTAALNNDFYRFANASTLYADPAASDPLAEAEWAQLPGEADVYYTKVEYSYTGDSVTEVAKANVPYRTTKADLLSAVLQSGFALLVVNGVMTAPAGLPTVVAPHSLDQAKCDQLTWVDDYLACPDGHVVNPTGTAPLARDSHWYGNATIHVHLGNNGYLGYDLPGRLVISKSVQAAGGLNPAPGQLFQFQVELEADSQPLADAFRYAVHNVADPTTLVREGQVTSGSVIELANDERATVFGLPDKTAYVVSETSTVPGYSQLLPESGSSATGIVNGGSTEAAEAVFVNLYQPAPAVLTAQPVAWKSLAGRGWLPDDSFTVVMCETDESIEDPASACRQLDFLYEDHGPKSFDSTVFTAPGVYTYELTEVTGQAPGVSYSTSVYQWVVTVTDDGEGQLLAEAELFDSQGSAREAAAFVNNFDVKSISGNLEALKEISDPSLPGDESRAPSLPYEFKFEYVGQSSESEGYVTPPPFGTDCVEMCHSAVSQNQPGGRTVASPTLTFKPEHVGSTFYYRASEIDPGLGFVTPSAAVWFWKLPVSFETQGEEQIIQVLPERCSTTVDKVTDENPYGDCVSGAPGYSADKQVLFVNAYKPGVGQVTLGATKLLQGRDWADSDQFRFDLAAGDKATADAIEAKSVKLPASTTVTLRGAGDASRDFAFDPIEFSKQGQYQFKITEAVPAAGERAGVVYDEHVLVYNVVVTDANVADGALTVNWTRSGSSTFTNRYQATRIFGGADVGKTLTGRDLAAGQFNFTVTPADDAARAKAGFPTMAGMTEPNVAGGGDPAVTHLPGDFEFTQDDLGKTFGYTITEDPGTLGGVTYDTTEYCTAVSPRYDPSTGSIYVETVIDAGCDGVVEETHDSRRGTLPTVTFANRYQAAPVNLTPSFNKTLVGRDWQEGESFEFEITPVDAAPAPAYSQRTVTAVGAVDGQVTFDFGAITFEAAGVYHYQVSELVPDPPKGGLLYDQTTVSLTVTVQDNGQGQLVATPVYGGRSGFDNRYMSGGDYTVEILKTLEGRALAAGEFQFSVTPVNELSADRAGLPATGSVWSNVAGAGDGVAVVTSYNIGLSLTQDDAGQTYCYVYAEVIPAVPAGGVTYDRRSYEVCLTVSDDGAGRMTFDTVVTDSDGSETSYRSYSDDVAPSWPQVSFVNRYVQPTWSLAKTASPSDGSV
ncbi:MAG: VWA domain-containing protein, partial [Propionibacteriaceae bacterium]|nr:VWA domain-containing protein [Propionibacteriaceae bacterium]